MQTFTKGFKFHVATNTAITYTVAAVDRKTRNLDLTWVFEGELKTSCYFLPMAEKFLKTGEWIAGSGSEVMQVLIPTKRWYSGDKKLNQFLLDHAGQWIDVETDHLFGNQYKVEGFGLCDHYVAAVRNDQRVKGFNVEEEPIFNTWGGVKPEMLISSEDCNKAEFTNNYSLENVNGAYYRFGGYGSMRFNFLYKDGVFYESNGIGYKRLRTLNKKAAQVVIPQLKKFFTDNHK